MFVCILSSGGITRAEICGISTVFKVLWGLKMPQKARKSSREAGSGGNKAAHVYSRAEGNTYNDDDDDVYLLEGAKAKGGRRRRGKLRKAKAVA